MRPLLFALLLACLVTGLARLTAPGPSATDMSAPCIACAVTAEAVFADGAAGEELPGGPGESQNDQQQVEAHDPSLDHADRLTPLPPPSRALATALSGMRPASWDGAPAGGFDPPLRPPSVG